MNNPSESSIVCLFLIAPNFDNLLVLHFLASVREAGVASALVSLTPGLTKGASGARVRADFSIKQLPETTLPRWVFVLENRTGTTALLTDPRVRQLLERTLSNNGSLVILTETQVLFQAAGFSEAVLIPELAKTRSFLVREIVRELVG